VLDSRRSSAGVKREGLNEKACDAPQHRRQFLSELVSEAKFPGNRQKYRDFYRRDLRVRLLARNPEPKSVVYDPIPYASEQGSYCWTSRELNRGHQGINSPDQRTPRFGCDFNPPKPSIRTTRPRRAGCPEEAELHLSGGDPAAIVAFCRERLVSYKVPARLAFRTAAQLPRSSGAAPRRSGKSRRASAPQLD